MLSVVTSKSFKKSFQKKDSRIQKQALLRIRLFREDPFNRVLNNHSLGGEYVDKRSINVTGDFRIIFYYVDENTVCLVDIGTHAELYR